MRYGWIFILPIVAIVLSTILSILHRMKHSQDRSLKKTAVIAHTRTIKMLPAYRRAKRNYFIMLGLAAVCFLISIFSLTAVAARPIEAKIHNTELENRDIILCLDVSGSMTSYYQQLLETFTKIIDDMHGERFGITIFDGKPANVIPLSDDYDALADVIQELSENLNYKLSWDEIVKSDSSSKIGDGVMGCINSISDYEHSERAKSIIVATDNIYGEQTVDINQAARYANRYGITMYGIYTYSSNGTSGRYYKEFENATTITGGAIYLWSEDDGNDISKSLANKILQQEAGKSTGAPEILYLDSPTIGIIVSAVSFVAFLILIWRLRL